MSLSFPLALSEFFNDLPIASFTFDLGNALEMSETGGGEILIADLGNRLWTLECEFATLSYAQAEAIKAKFNTLRIAGRSLFAHAMPIAYPQSDPDGSILGSSTVTLNAIHANAHEIKLAGLPVGYDLTPGDMLSFTYGSSPTRYAMHQVVTAAEANGSGVTDYFDVVPHIPTGAATSATVTLKKPYFKAVAVPGSFNPGKSQAQRTDGLAFKLVQTLR